MAFSLAALVFGSGIASAQYGTSGAPRPIYNTTISPWPAAPATPSVPAASGWGGTMPPPPPEVPRTMYYKKDSGWGVVPASNSFVVPPPTVAPPPKKDDRDAPPPPVSFTLDNENQLNDRINDAIYRRKNLDLAKQRQKDEKTREANRKAVAAGQKPSATEGQFFPDLPHATTEVSAAARSYAERAVMVEPHYVCYRRLFFEEKNTERYGWDMGPLTTVGLCCKFLGDWTNLPYKVCSFPSLRYDSSAGQCLPGDPVPFMSYPPGLSVTGGLGEAGALVALRAIFPK